MWKETEIDGGLLSSRDRDMLADLVAEYLKEHVEDYYPDGDFQFEVKVEYVAKPEPHPAYEDCTGKTYSVWVGGTQVHDYLLSKEDAEIMAEEYLDSGYGIDEVYVDDGNTL